MAQPQEMIVDKLAKEGKITVLPEYRMSEERKKMEIAFMGDFWTLRKAFANPQVDDDTYWESLVTAVDALGETYGHDSYCDVMLIQLVGDIEARVDYKSERKRFEQCMKLQREILARHGLRLEICSVRP